MISHVWSVLCLRVIVDGRTNNVSLIDVVEEITIHGPISSSQEGQITALQFELNIASLWRREPENQPTKGQIRFCLLTPNHKKHLDSSVHSLDLSEKLRMRIYNKIPFLPFYGPGIYRFLTELQAEGETEWKEVASVPLVVKVQEVQEAVPSEKEKEL